MPTTPQPPTRRRTTFAVPPAPRPRDAVGCAVEIAQIATRQKDDPRAQDPQKSVLRALCDKQ